MIYLVPLTSSDSNYEQIVTLDGVDYTLRFLWNTRSGYWFLTIRNGDGDDLVTGRKVVADTPFANHDTAAGMPPGQLWFVDLTQQGLPPGLRDLGSRVVLLYVDKDSAS